MATRPTLTRRPDAVRLRHQDVDCYFRQTARVGRAMAGTVGRTSSPARRFASDFNAVTDGAWRVAFRSLALKQAVRRRGGGPIAELNPSRGVAPRAPSGPRDCAVCSAAGGSRAALRPARGRETRRIGAARERTPDRRAAGRTGAPGHGIQRPLDRLASADARRLFLADASHEPHPVTAAHGGRPGAHHPSRREDDARREDRLRSDEASRRITPICGPPEATPNAPRIRRSCRAYRGW